MTLSSLHFSQLAQPSKPRVVSDCFLANGLRRLGVFIYVHLVFKSLLFCAVASERMHCRQQGLFTCPHSFWIISTNVPARQEKFKLSDPQQRPAMVVRRPPPN